MKVENILEEREVSYGKFTTHAELAQDLKQAIKTNMHPLKSLDADQAEALDMICHKIARIINGNPDYIDNWVDIAGYAMLVANRLEEG